MASPYRFVGLEAAHTPEGKLRLAVQALYRFRLEPGLEVQAPRVNAEESVSMLSSRPTTSGPASEETAQPGGDTVEESRPNHPSGHSPSLDASESATPSGGWQARLGKRKSAIRGCLQRDNALALTRWVSRRHGID